MESKQCSKCQIDVDSDQSEYNLPVYSAEEKKYPPKKATLCENCAKQIADWFEEGKENE